MRFNIPIAKAFVEILLLDSSHSEALPLLSVSNTHSQLMHCANYMDSASAGPSRSETPPNGPPIDNVSNDKTDQPTDDQTDGQTDDQTDDQTDGQTDDQTEDRTQDSTTDEDTPPTHKNAKKSAKSPVQGKAVSVATAEDIKLAELCLSKSREPGVYVMPIKIWTKCILAAYLDMQSIGELNRFITVNTGLVNHFMTSRKNNFGIQYSTRSTTVTTSSWTVVKIFQKLRHLTRNETHVISNATFPIHALSLDRNDFSRAYLAFLHACFLIIEQNPDYFKQKHKEDIYVLNISVEDWHRAYRILIEICKSDNPSKKAKPDGRMPRGDHIPTLSYMTTAEAQMLIDEVKTSPRKSHSPTWMDTEEEWTKYVQSIQNGESPIPPHEMLSNTLQGTTPDGVLGELSDNRQSLSKEHLIAFLKYTASTCNVVHDAPSRPQVIEGHPEDAFEYMTFNAKDKADYVKMVGRASSVSAIPPPFTTACDRMDVDPETFIREGLDFAYKPWQITDIAWMLMQEASLIQGGILANDMGLGKTVICYGFIYEHYCQLMMDKDPSAVYRPTLVLCPSSLINVHIKDIERFEGKLNVKIFWGNGKGIPPNWTSNVLSDLNQLEDFVEKLDPKNPETAKVVILSTYSTWARRTTLIQEWYKGEYKRDLSQEEVSDMKKANKVQVSITEDMEDIDPETQAYRDTLDGFQNQIREGYTFKMVSQFKDKFLRAILDEGHLAKNPETITHQSVSNLNAPHNWIMSATPLINSVSDLYGFLSLFWDEERLQLLPGHEEIPMDDRYDHEFDMGNVILPPSTELKNFYPYAGPSDDWEQYQEYKIGRLWILDPKSFKHVADTEGFHTLNCRMVITPILRLIQLRRTLDSVIDLGDGTAIKIRDSVPSFQYRVVELEPDSIYQEKYDDIYSKYIPELHLSANTNNNGIISGAATGIGKSGSRNPGLHRLLAHATFHPLLDDLTCKLSQSNVDSINKWRKFDEDHGGSWFFRMTRTQDFYQPPITRDQLAHYVNGLCPKIKWLSGYIAEHAVQNNERVLVMTEWPMTQWMLEVHFALLGLKVLTLRSEMSPAARQAVIEKFNDKNYKCHMLLSCTSLSGFGANYQACCSKAVIIESSGQINGDLQAGARIVRIGQTEHCDIVLLMCHRTYDVVVWAKKLHKFRAQVASQGAIISTPGANIDDQVDKIIRDLLGLRLDMRGDFKNSYYDFEKIVQAPASSSTGYKYNHSYVPKGGDPAKKHKHKSNGGILSFGEDTVMNNDGASKGMQVLIDSTMNPSSQPDLLAPIDSGKNRECSNFPSARGLSEGSSHDSAYRQNSMMDMKEFPDHAMDPLHQPSPLDHFVPNNGYERVRTSSEDPVYN
ncbi:hypothetical protein BTUL_0125g00020 [Botrytis tulipae]|uniref:Helicase ATP-binding domain-containing protein n=1 Tax=Botrytis tulipae TaxID=87230 RepID=A0A4Z1EHV5_9HELO|nr:hypothetical protein BTUL_0125g00020 [Botrytis tulipae]